MMPDIITNTIEQVAQANPTRCKPSLDRRVTKLIEELGEVAEAFLNVTSANNYKNKTWDDVHEEAADVLIIAIDIALTPLDEVDQSRLCNYVQQHMHRINMGFHSLIWRISHLNSCFGGSYPDDHATADQYAAELVRYAFALVDLVFDDHTQIITEVRRKIKKWRRRGA